MPASHSSLSLLVQFLFLPSNAVLQVPDAWSCYSHLVAMSGDIPKPHRVADWINVGRARGFDGIIEATAPASTLLR